MNLIIPVVNLQTIFGHTTNTKIFWTEICQTSRTWDGLEQFFSETGTTTLHPAPAGPQTVAGWQPPSQISLDKSQPHVNCREWREVEDSVRAWCR